jgi:hypothetical protein
VVKGSLSFLEITVTFFAAFVVLRPTPKHASQSVHQIRIIQLWENLHLSAPHT